MSICWVHSVCSGAVSDGPACKWLFVLLSSDTDDGERAGCEVVNASSGRVYIRQVSRSYHDHYHRICTTLSRYVLYLSSFTVHWSIIFNCLSVPLSEVLSHTLVLFIISQRLKLKASGSFGFLLQQSIWWRILQHSCTFAWFCHSTLN